jgi:hypothetical protein
MAGAGAYLKIRWALKMINKRKNEKGTRTKTKTRTGARAWTYMQTRGAVTVIQD